MEQIIFVNFSRASSFPLYSNLMLPSIIWALLLGFFLIFGFIYKKYFGKL
jgi:hypothetical protein